MNLHRRLLLLLVAALMVAVTAVATVGPAFGKVGQNKASGTAGELAGEWWKWVLSKPVAESPLIGSDSSDPPYSEEQCNGQPVNPVSDTANKYWFLAGTFDGSEVERTCTAPSDTRPFFPVANFAYINTDPETDTEELARQIAKKAIDSIEADPKLSMSVKVDGKEVKNNQIVRADSPLFTATVPEDGLLPAGSYTGVADGLWATLPPLSEGKHTIQFKMSAPNADMDPTTEENPLGFSQDNTYHLTVE